jgi:WD40 repeat protein
MVRTPDGQLMATHQGYKGIDYITVWDVAKGRECYRIYHAIDTIDANQSANQSPQTYSNKETKGYLYDIAFSPNGRILVTAGADGKIKLWRSNDGHKITQWKYQHHYPKVTYSRDGKLLMVHTTLEEKEQGYQRNRDLVDIRSAEDGYRNISKIEGYFSKVRMTKDGKKIVTAEGKIERRLTKMTDHRPISVPAAFWGIRVWDATTGNELLRLPYQRVIQNVAINHKGDVMGSHFYGEGFLRFFDTSSGKIIKEIPDNGDSSGHSICFSPDDSAVAIISYKNIVVWDTETWQVIDRISPTDSIDRFRSQFSPVRNLLAWKSGKGKIWIWDWMNDRKIAIINANNSYGPFLFSPDEKHLISADDQGNVNFFLWRNKDLIADACRRLEHNLSEQDWQTYMGTIPYEPTCSGLPAADTW